VPASATARYFGPSCTRRNTQVSISIYRPRHLHQT
jgi:hypothetical protein